MPAEVAQDPPRVTRARSKATTAQLHSAATPNPQVIASAATTAQPTRDTIVTASAPKETATEPNGEAQAVAQTAPAPDHVFVPPTRARPKPKPIASGSLPTQSDGSAPVRARNHKDKGADVRMSKATPLAITGSGSVPVLYVYNPIPSTIRLTVVGLKQKHATREHRQKPLRLYKKVTSPKSMLAA